MAVTSPRTNRQAKHRGLAVVELAICLPILAVVLLATVETCAMIQLQQNLAVTAYEGARIGIIPGTSTASIQTQCDLLLEDRGIANYSYTMNPTDLASMVPGDTFTLTIEADCANNSLFGGWYYDGKKISESVSMRAE